MSKDEVEVEFDAPEPIDFERLAREELEKHAIRVQASWRENLSNGEGAEGSHGGEYRNTGEAINDLTFEFSGDLEVTVGGDVIQLAVAEFGRAPGSVPPREPIERWAREKGLQPEDGDFDSMVDAIRFSIGENGLEPFAPGTAAALEHRGELEQNLSDRISDEITSALED